MVSIPLVCSAPSVPKTGGAFSNFFALSSPFEADIISLQIVIFVKYKTQKEKPMKELLQEQSEELKTYIDLKHKEMEELIAESEGRLCEQIREKSKR